MAGLVIFARWPMTERCNCGRPLIDRPGELGLTCAQCSDKPGFCACPPMTARIAVAPRGKHRTLPPPGQVADDPLPDEPWTQLGYSNRLVEVYGRDMRFVHTWKRWLVWDGERWALDVTGQAQRWARLVARSMTDVVLASDDPGMRKDFYPIAEKGETNAFIAGTLTLATFDHRVAISHDALDADPFLFNCPNGTLDLRTDEMRDHDRADLITKVTGAPYEPGAPDAAFSAFLADVQPDERMRSYLARLFGHALEGRVSEHVLPICYGTGANGKSTLIAAIMAALGDYAAPADPELLTARNFDAHPTGVADLFGLRLAILHEGDRGRRLAEGTVKRLTGGDQIKARRMREDFWSFDPSHMFVMLTNHRPVVQGTDEGIWRRLRIVPWDVVIPEDKRDEALGERLALEASAVLAWLVAGHADWKVNGLGEPGAVTDATTTWQADSDAVARFIAEKCTQGNHVTAGSTQLFTAWEKWCQIEGEDPGSHKGFTTALENKGFDKYQSNGRNRWRGIGVLSPDPGPEE